MKKFTYAMNAILGKMRFWGTCAMKNLDEVISRDEAEGFIDTALKILISVVVGALLLAGLYMLFKDTLLPTLTQRIIDLFDFQG